MLLLSEQRPFEVTQSSAISKRSCLRKHLSLACLAFAACCLSSSTSIYQHPPTTTTPATRTYSHFHFSSEMLTDNPINYPLHTSFEDFFNFELLAGPSNSQSSPDSGSSPSDSSSAILSTPPNPFPPVDVATDSQGYFSFSSFEDTFSKLDRTSLPSPTGTPLDIFGASSYGAGPSAASTSSKIGRAHV